MGNILNVDSNNNFISFSEPLGTLSPNDLEKNKRYGKYLKDDNFTIINNFNIINDFIIKKRNVTKEEFIIFKNYIKNKYLNINKLYINIFKLCNFDKDDIIFNDTRRSCKPVIISLDSQDKLQVVDSNNQVINTAFPEYLLSLTYTGGLENYLNFIFTAKKDFLFTLDDEKNNSFEDIKYMMFNNIIAIPNSYLIPDTSIIEFTFTNLLNILNKDKEYNMIYYIALIKKYFIILIAKLNKSSINFNIKIANVYYFINCISILMFITGRDKDKKYINNCETFLINLTNILPDMNCNITNELYTFNPDFIMNQNNDIYSYFTNTIYGNSQGSSLMYNIYYCCCSILCCICILFSLYKIFKK